MRIVLLLFAGLVVFPFLLRKFAQAIGKAALDKQPGQIHLQRQDRAQWTNSTAADTIARALAWKGFEDAGCYAIAELPEVHLQLFTDTNRSMLANLYEHPKTGVWFELVTRYEDGTTASFSTLPATGLNPRPGHVQVSAPGLDVSALLDRALGERPAKRQVRVRAADAAALFATGWADHMAWRKRQGISAAEVAQVAKRRKAA